MSLRRTENTASEKKAPSLAALAPRLGLRMLGFALSFAMISASCTTPSTDVLVSVDTDARDRITNLHVTIARGTLITAGSATRSWNAGPATSDLHMPATFGTVPGEGEARDQVVTVQLEALFAPVSPDAPMTTLRRTVRFSFVPNVTSFVHVFLNTSCANLVAAPARCGGEALTNCTMQRYCEEQTPALTCGDHATCTQIDVEAAPLLPDGGIPVSIEDVRADRPRDAGALDAATMDIRVPDATPIDVATVSDTAVDTALPSDRGTPEACVADCTARLCGPNGCGGSCGTCPTGRVCDATGRCACVPNCAGRVCGNDGCAGSCGACGGTQVCDGSGHCVATCTPNCAGRVCGSDGCAGSCGTCGAMQTCDGSGTCVCAPNCAGRTCGGDGCGGSCGSCTTGQTCTGAGTCVCAPNCAGRNCGPDGCGGSCGTCGGTDNCNASGVCVPCVPNCAFRSCGSDGCGGSCGSCGTNQRCACGGDCICSGCVCP